MKVAIDRNETNRVRARYEDDQAVVARFLEPTILYRIFDGEELVRIAHTGEIAGGMFAMTQERGYGASWTSNIDGLVSWARSWQKPKRIGKDLFIARIDAHGMLFYHDGPELPFYPDGPEEQIVDMDPSVCSTGLGCSVRAPIQMATLFRVTRDDRVGEITWGYVEQYVHRRPLKPVMLRPFHSTSFSGTILGYGVFVSLDRTDNYWEVRAAIDIGADHREVPVIMGARSKKRAIEAAVEQLQYGIPPQPIYLNKRPPGFELVAPKQVYESKFYGPYGRLFKVARVGASYVYGHWVDAPKYDARFDAKRFLREFRLVQPASR